MLSKTVKTFILLTKQLKCKAFNRKELLRRMIMVFLTTQCMISASCEDFMCCFFVTSRQYMHQDIRYEMHLKGNKKSYFMINYMRCYHKMLFMFSWIQLIFSMVYLTEPLKKIYIPRNLLEGLYSQSIFHGMLLMECCVFICCLGS